MTDRLLAIVAAAVVPNQLDTATALLDQAVAHQTAIVAQLLASVGASPPVRPRYRYRGGCLRCLCID
jgi:hypothetical protein